MKKTCSGLCSRIRRNQIARDQRPHRTYSCKFCGDEFAAKRKSTVCAAVECRRAVRREYGRNDWKNISPERKARKLLQKRQYEARWRSKGVAPPSKRCFQAKECARCGASFASRYGRYCSSECRYPVKISAPSVKPSKPSKPCIVCGVGFRATTNQKTCGSLICAETLIKGRTPASRRPGRTTSETVARRLRRHLASDVYDALKQIGVSMPAGLSRIERRRWKDDLLKVATEEQLLGQPQQEKRT